MDILRPPRDRRVFKRYISEQCIGYRYDANGRPTHSVYSAVVEYTDGTRGVITETLPVLRNTLH